MTTLAFIAFQENAYGSNGCFPGKRSGLVITVSPVFIETKPLRGTPDFPGAEPTIGIDPTGYQPLVTSVPNMK